jgi:hypothetical protein
MVGKISFMVVDFIILFMFMLNEEDSLLNNIKIGVINSE